MAATSTNKQPLLVDRVLHEVQPLAFRTVANDAGTTIGGLNDAAMLIDCTQGDGAIIEDIYVISRGAAYTVNVYLSTANDYLRPNQGVFVSSVESLAQEGSFQHLIQMPYILAPVPQAGDVLGTTGSAVPLQFRAIYVPRGKALWAAAQKVDANDDGSSAPIIGVQGGYY